MRVLVANKFGYPRGGLERVMFAEIEWLQDAGHEVALFTTRHPENLPSKWEPYFAPYIELGSEARVGFSQRVVAAARMFGNSEAARQFARLADAFKPDVVHAHGIHRQISPSILAPAAARNIPVVQTLHDYHHICPADALLYTGIEPCDPRRCGRLWYGAAVAGRCVRGSFSASALSAAETAWARARGVYERGVARFISPSRFMAEQMRAGGWELPFDIVPNATVTTDAPRSAGEGFVVVGRLAREKGVAVALQAASEAGVSMTVVGTGPLEAELRSAYPQSRFTGQLDREHVSEVVGRARAVVVPSVWFENASMTVLEALGAGVPVIASAIGGIPEQVANDSDGLLVPPGDVCALAEAMRALDDKPELAMRLGERGRQTVGTRFTPRVHLAGLLESYERAIEGLRS
jgi:glycosyltransferase involved in cell wall biosynthesis